MLRGLARFFSVYMFWKEIVKRDIHIEERGRLQLNKHNIQS